MFSIFGVASVRTLGWTCASGRSRNPPRSDSHAHPTVDATLTAHRVRMAAPPSPVCLTPALHAHLPRHYASHLPLSPSSLTAWARPGNRPQLDAPPDAGPQLATSPSVGPQLVTPHPPAPRPCGHHSPCLHKALGCNIHLTQMKHLKHIVATYV
jgi:hypothetical protein